MGQPVKKMAQIHQKKESPTLLIKGRETDELVIGLCGAVGSGVSTVGKIIAHQLSQYGYTTSFEKATEHIMSIKTPPETNSEFERIYNLQTLGSEIRSEYGNNYLSQLIIWGIAEERNKSGAKQLKKAPGDIDHEEAAERTRRHVTIVDSLKNPAEVELLKMVYGSMFYMFGILCDDHERERRLKNKGNGMEPHEAKQLMERDKQEKEDNGQHVLKTLQLADFFVRNNNRAKTATETSVDRFIQLILRQNNITPTIEEYGMYVAESTAKLSGCMSRQVGAAILSPAGDIIATGRNDVPSPNGGLYWEGGATEDCRCFKVDGTTCENHRRKDIIYGKIEGLLNESFTNLKTPNNSNLIDSSIKDIILTLRDDSEIKDLLEYSKAVHAEMDAITTAARIGNRSLDGSTLYSTTFPCHHCARHIIASGIKTVYYIEPYEKSLAKALHDDAIDLGHEQQGGSNKKVKFLHFEGVAPKQYFTLFTCNNRKKDGKLNKIDLSQQKPAATTYLDSFIEREAKVVQIVTGESEKNTEDKHEQG